MHKLYFIFIIFFVFSCEEKMNYNYIENYYQYVYDADIAYLEEDYDKAYLLLKKAEANCPLLNQPIYYEVAKLAELSIIRNKYNDALKYIERLIKIEGYDFSNFENNPQYIFLHEYEEWKDLKENHKLYKEKYISKLNLVLREEIKDMKVLDQMYRQRGEYNMEKCDSIDTINENRIKEIIKQYGVPDKDVIGPYKLDMTHVNIHAMFMHFADTSYFKKVLLPLVKQGKCSPDIYPSMVDSRQRRTGEFIYGTYSNHSEDDVIDSKNLNKRRLSVGLPTKETQTKRQEIMMEKYKI